MYEQRKNSRAILLPPGRGAPGDNTVDEIVICFECDHRQRDCGNCEKCGGSTEILDYWHGPDFVEDVGSSSPAFI